jgi:hypothetical protein
MKELSFANVMNDSPIDISLSKEDKLAFIELILDEFSDRKEKDATVVIKALQKVICAGRGK